MTYVAGAFREKATTAEAIRQLKAKGFTPADLEVFSDEPIEFDHGVFDQPSKMSLVAVCGASCFFLGIVGFVYFTQHDYPLVTGGMPIFSFWPTGVVFYEITMLGAILTTFGWFIWESGLLRRDRSIPVPTVEPGAICLRVRCALAAQATETAELLEQAGAQAVRPL